ncbi:MAG TPA: peptidoglycan-binding protein [Solirubrobacteraceae bacterium]|nr:peptidoglycan-binding protein [Solirubrobacteraceae bacterium]
MKGRFRMPGFPRDLAAVDPWDASLARSRERRRRAAGGRSAAARSLASLIEATNRPARDRDLADGEPWELSLGRSRTRRRASELRFVPAASRAKRVSLGALAALTAGPTASLADGSAPHPSPAPSPDPSPTTTAEHHIVLTPGSHGRQVRLLQVALGIPSDGVYGPKTSAAVRQFQASRGLPVDDVVGPATSAALHNHAPAVVSPAAVRAKLAAANKPASAAAQSAAHTGASAHTAVAKTAAHTASGDPVAHLQRALKLPADGDFGRHTEAAIRRLQARHGLTVDGVVGPATWRLLGVNGEQDTLTPPASALPHARHHARTASTDGGDASSSVSSASSSTVQRVIAAGEQIATAPYVYGGGHGSFQSSGYDCSGSVSYALHGGGLLSSPEDSSALESYGASGPGKHITIYANAGHAFMVVDGRRFDTVARQEGGSRWTSSMTSTAGYVARHPVGL